MSEEAKTVELFNLHNLLESDNDLLDKMIFIAKNCSFGQKAQSSCLTSIELNYQKCEIGEMLKSQFRQIK